MDNCVHYWILEPNNGLESKGVCKYCKETKMFPNIVQVAQKDIKPWGWCKIEKKTTENVY